MYDKKYYETQASEEEYLDWYLTQDHPTYEKASITTDMVAFKVKKYDIINKQGNTEVICMVKWDSEGKAVAHLIQLLVVLYSKLGG